MRVKKIAVTVLILVLTANALCGCSLLGYIKNEDPERIVTYVNDDYHFTLTHPAYFSKTETKEYEDNDDEINIKLIASEDDLIDIDIRYKNEKRDSSSTLFDYIVNNGFDKNRIVPLTSNSFSYDDREGETYAYHIYAATKRMIYIISYAHKPDNEKEQFVIDSLSVGFDMYANIPKENAFLSSPYKFAYGTCSFQALADAEVSFDIEPTYGEDGTADYRFCRTVYAESQTYKVSFGSPLVPRYSYFEIDTIDLSAEAAALTDELCPGLENVVFGEVSEKVNGRLKYKIVPFECTYNGVTSVGSLTIGFSTLTYFEYVCVINDTVTDAELQNYSDMLATIKV